MIINLKNKTFSKKGFVFLKNGETDEVVLPIKTLSILEDIQLNIEDLKIAIPKVTSAPTIQEEKILRQIDPNFSTRASTLVVRYDIANAVYKDTLEKFETYKRIWAVVKYIDMDYMDEGMTETLWQQAGVKKGDVIGLCDWVGFTLQLKANDFESILFEVKKLNGESAFDKLAELKKFTGADATEIFALMGLKDKLEKMQLDLKAEYPESNPETFHENPAPKETKETEQTNS